MRRFWIALLFWTACSHTAPFYVIPLHEDGWRDKAGQCCCVVDRCTHKGQEMRCVYHRWCSQDQIEACMENTRVQ